MSALGPHRTAFTKVLTCSPSGLHKRSAFEAPVASCRSRLVASRARPSRPSPAPDLVPLAQPREAAFRPFELCSLDWTRRHFTRTSRARHSAPWRAPRPLRLTCAPPHPCSACALFLLGCRRGGFAAASRHSHRYAPCHRIKPACWITLHTAAAKTRRESGPGTGVRRDRRLAISHTHLPPTAPTHPRTTTRLERHTTQPAGGRAGSRELGSRVSALGPHRTAFTKVLTCSPSGLHKRSAFEAPVASCRSRLVASRARPSRPSPAPDLVPLAQPREAAFRPFELCSLDWTRRHFTRTSRARHSAPWRAPRPLRLTCAPPHPCSACALFLLGCRRGGFAAASRHSHRYAPCHRIKPACWITLHTAAAKTRRESGPGTGVRRDRRLAISHTHLPLTAPTLAAASPAERRPPRPRLRSRRAPQNSWSWYSPPSRSP